MTVKIKL